MNWRRMAMRMISEVSSVSSYLSNDEPSYRILMYHAVDGKVIGDRLNIFGISRELFIEHMEILKNKSIKVVDLNEVHLSTMSDCLSITFDDGYNDNLHVAAPILADYNFPFTVFVSTSYVEDDSNNFLSPIELRELASMPNVTIGAHGVKHVELAKCGDEQLNNELISSKHYLEDVIGKSVNTLAYPHGSVNQRVRNVVESVGYKIGTTSYMSTNRKNQDPLLLARTSVLGIDTPHVFKQKIRGCWDWYKFKQQNPMKTENGIK